MSAWARAGGRLPQERSRQAWRGVGGQGVCAPVGHCGLRSLCSMAVRRAGARRTEQLFSFSRQWLQERGASGVLNRARQWLQERNVPCDLWMWCDATARSTGQDCCLYLFSLIDVPHITLDLHWLPMKTMPSTMMPICTSPPFKKKSNSRFELREVFLNFKV
jgi:hypothetical protein